MDVAATQRALIARGYDLGPGGADALGGCIKTVQPVAIAPGAPVVATRADLAIARTSEQLARYCGLTRAAVAAVGLFASAKVQDAAGHASAVLDEVCAAPPTNVRTAIDTIGRAYTAVIVASAAE